MFDDLCCDLMGGVFEDFVYFLIFFCIYLCYGVKVCSLLVFDCEFKMIDYFVFFDVVMISDKMCKLFFEF